MKTIKEAAKKYSEKVFFLSDYPHHMRSSFDGFKAGVEFAQRWIPVEEELPTKRMGVSDVVIAKNDELNYSFTSYYNYDGKSWKIYPSGREIKVTHWRPIELK